MARRVRRSTAHQPRPTARQVAEEARETEWTAPSFLKEIFLGNLRLDLVHPFPAADLRAPRVPRVLGPHRALPGGGSGLRTRSTATGKIPPHVIQRLAELGAFGMKIPKEYGGLGFSQREYSRGDEARHEPATATSTALLSAHQSIGVPQPLKLFGTKEQKKKYLPRLAQGAVSAFALTEPEVGSDPGEPRDDARAHARRRTTS